MRSRAGPGRWLVLTASMGAGHMQVGRELAHQVRSRGGEVLVVDLLEIMPAGVGQALRSGYAGMLHAAPWLYDWIFRTFFLDHRRCSPSVYPLDVIAARRLVPLVERYQPGAVISTFHLAGQVVGRMRLHGQLSIPSVVAITEPAAHRQWLHPGTDLFLCPYPWVAAHARERTGIPAIAPGPLVDERFRRPADPDPGRRILNLDAGESAVLISTGSWGVGQAFATASSLAGRRGVRPVVLCGRNDELRRRIDQLPGCQGLGWRDDLPELFAASSVLVDQSGGSTCAEAFAAGLPVVLYEPLPGHGRFGAEVLAGAGVVSFAKDPQALLADVRRLSRPDSDRNAQLARASAVFQQEPVEVLLRSLPAGGVRTVSRDRPRARVMFPWVRARHQQG